MKLATQLVRISGFLLVFAVNFHSCFLNVAVQKETD